MITLFYRNTLLFIFLVKMTVSSKYFKQYRLASHKVNHQVFPSETIDGSYTVYVAGKVFTIKVPANVEDDPYKIVNWKVMNSNPNRLMYISDGSAYILIDQETKKKLTFPYENIGSIIVLGSNEALHMPKILYRRNVEPIIPWNYFELLHFDEKKETIKIIESIPWLNNFDWYYIHEWKMLDYAFIESKLYVVSSRKVFSHTPINDDEEPNLRAEMFITRFSLDVDKNLLSTAIELHKRLRFGYRIAQFVNTFQLNDDNNRRFSLFILHTTKDETYFTRAFLPKLNHLFETVESCAKAGNCISIYQHFFNKICLKPTCPAYPTSELTFVETEVKNVSIVSNFRSYIGGYPDAYYWLIYFDQHELFGCDFANWLDLNCFPIQSFPGINFKTDLVLDVISGKTFYFPNSTQLYQTLPYVSDKYPCSRFLNCLDCIMFGFSVGCIWIAPVCEQRSTDQVYSYKEFTVNFCLEIVAFSLEPYKELSKKLLEIEFNAVFSKRQIKQISVFVGPDNECIETERETHKLTCLLSYNSPGKFPIEVKFSNDDYLDTTPIIVTSSDTILIENETTSLWIKFAFVAFFVVIVFILTTILILLYSKQPEMSRMLSERSKSFTSKPGRTPSSVESVFLSDSVSTTISARKAVFKNVKVVKNSFKIKQFQFIGGKRFKRFIN
uniref:Transmembrane protein n=1 Tax=Tetranychus urticae TaxID=32264 RepID=T1KDY3_TETUR